MQVRVQIDEQGALRNQRYAFSDRYTLISELMQNARRAGATKVCIDYDAQYKKLKVSDDGCGIADFQKLMTFNDSGWDKETCTEERPFGIGFSKCLYSASRCIVRSLGRQVDFLTNSALEQSWIDVTTVDTEPGTQITLYDVDLPFLEKRIFELAEGFAIPVIFNSQDVPRPHAADALPYIETEIGRIWLKGTDDGESTRDTVIYLQGFCVRKPLYHYQANQLLCNVVHLDSKRFTARLPDRDQLIDEDEQKVIIDQTIKACWREVLMEKKSTLPAVDFVDRFLPTLRTWGHIDLLNDVPVLPRQLCKRIVDYPYQEGMSDRDYLSIVDKHITRETVEQGGETLIDLDDTNEDNMAYWMYAWARNFVVFDNYLADGHWVNKHVRSLENNERVIEIVTEQCRAEFSSRWIWPTVVICESYAITIGGVRVEIDDVALYHGALAIIPRHEVSGAVCGQISDYIDENDQHFQDDREADMDALLTLIRRLRAVDPESTMRSLLAELALEKYPLLQGKTFTVLVGDKPDAHGITLVA
ncbi:MAG: ATP-binding protein [Pseudomonadota bacterium]